MTVSLGFVIAGTLCVLVDLLFGARKWQGDMDIAQRVRHRSREQPLTILGTVLLIIALALELLGV